MIFDHDIDLLRNADGFILVYSKDQSFELEQIEVDREDFRKWYVANADKIFGESIKELEKEIKHQRTEAKRKSSI